MVELAIIAAALLLLLLTVQYLPRLTSGLDRQNFTKRWRELDALFSNGGPGLKLAVIEADKLLDEALKRRGYGGETMGERMKQAGAALGNQDDVWQAHRLRNRLVHEQTKLSKPQAARALSAFKKSLKHLGAL
jgi:hypothetical protein